VTFFNSKVGIFCFSEDSNFFENFFSTANIKLINDPAHSELACLHFPYPYKKSFEQFVENNLSNFDRVLIVITELHEFTFNFCKKYDHHKITYVIAGTLNHPLEHSKVYTFMDWFNTTADVYHLFPEYLTELVPESNRLAFDALLGRRKPNRDFAFSFINERLPNCGIVRYATGQKFIDFTDTLQWESPVTGLDVGNITFTVETVEYKKHHIRLSHLVPVNIYNKTNFSVVAETNTSNNFVFLTEKTAKCLVAQRLFVILGNRYSLRFLHELGFKTFDCIIDEDYDNQSNPEDRFGMAMEQVEWLCKKDWRDIEQSLQPIVKHNHDLIMNTDWRFTPVLADAMQNWLGSCLWPRT